MESQAFLQQRVKELEKQLKSLVAERDQLAKDVEELCLQNSGSMFSGSSYVLSERIASTESELRDAKKQIEAVVAERDQLAEELTTTRSMKQATETSLVYEKEQRSKAESDAQFYQGQVTKLIAERDHLERELSEYREARSRTELQLSSVESKLESESRLRREAEQQLQARQQQLSQTRSELEAKSSDCVSLGTQLSHAKSSLKKLEASSASLQVSMHAHAGPMHHAVCNNCNAPAAFGCMCHAKMTQHVHECVLVGFGPH